jgi:asparaginyl-tRNA synthetase
MIRTKINKLTQKHIDTVITIKGWIKTVRHSKNLSFVEVNDGSQFNNIQVIIQNSLPNYQELVPQLTTGTSISVTGKLVKSLGTEQAFEIQAQDVFVIGTCSADEYPLQKKGHSFEFLRTIAHLRPRTNTMGAVARIRNALAFATHKFFQERDFLYVHTPIITGSDCEGAGQMFRVTTLDINNPARLPDGTLDNTQDFFGKPTFLTVSGQLNGETYACALSDIYTFGPTFRAENSNTSRHLAEFWMIEPELAFAELPDNMECAESYLKYCINYTLETYPQDMAFFDKQIAPGLLDRLKLVAQTPFEHITYTNAIEILKKAPKKFEFPVAWGTDLQSEHECYLTEEYCKKPVILTDYPAHIKSFYMHANPDGKTVAAMDILVPGIGEIIGGSQREARLDVLEQKIKQLGMNRDDYWWYLDLRKYGSVPHAGFGLGFERLVRFITGMENIRDVIPFPRYPKHADF